MGMISPEKEQIVSKLEKEFAQKKKLSQKKLKKQIYPRNKFSIK